MVGREPSEDTRTVPLRRKRTLKQHKELLLLQQELFIHAVHLALTLRPLWQQSSSILIMYQCKHVRLRVCFNYTNLGSGCVAIHIFLHGFVFSLDRKFLLRNSEDV